MLVVGGRAERRPPDKGNHVESRPSSIRAFGYECEHRPQDTGASLNRAPLNHQNFHPLSLAPEGSDARSRWSSGARATG